MFFSVFPLADPEEIIDCLEQSGLQLDRFVNPLIDYLTQEGRKDAAETVAKKCVVVVNQPQLPPVAESPSASSTTSSSSSAGATSSATPPLSEQQSEQVGHVQQQQPQQAYDPQSHVALVALLDPNTQVDKFSLFIV